MANQIVIDIIAETKKLTSGINDANSQLNGLSGGLGKAQQAAVGLASAFVLKEGVSFLKKAADEALDAEKTALSAAQAFGEGSAALKKITSDAEKFADELAIDNDEIIKLATGLGVRLPEDAKSSSAELVLLAKNLEASSAGAISAETTISKLGKAFADGEVTAKELSKTIPGLSDSVYAQAEALSKAGKNQEAMNLLVVEGQKKFGGAAADQVTGAQKIDKAMGDLYETIGTQVAPIIEKLSAKIADLIDFLVENKNVVIPLVTVLGGLAAIILAANTAITVYNGLLAAKKVAVGLATAAQWLFNAAMSANPIGLVIIAIAAIIAIIIVLVKNWDKVTEVVGKAWDKIKEFASGAWNALKDFGKKVAEFAQDVVEVFTFIPRKMFELGKNIVSGLWDGIQNMASWLKNKVFDFFGNLIPSWAKKMLGISSPSKVFAAFGENIVQGLAQGINAAENIAKNATLSLGNTTVGGLNIPSLSNTKSSAGINITINAGLGTNGPALGRQVSSAIKQYGKVSSQVAFGAR